MAAAIRLIVNADDLGLHSRIDEGILGGVRAGAISSVTVLVGGSHFEEAVRALKGLPCGVGVHLALSGGLPPIAPPEQVPSLLVQGRLRRSWMGFALDAARGRISLDQVERELEAQLARARDTGLVIDHVDGHQHLHVLPGVWERVRALCERFGIAGARIPAERLSLGLWRRPARAAKVAALGFVASRARASLGGLKSPHFWGLYDGGRLDQEALERLLERLPSGDHEIGCHPGLHPSVVPEDPSWKYQWEAELQALCSERSRDLMARRGIQLIRYVDL